MLMTQIYEIINDVTKEVLGDTAVVNEDLTNIIDIGEAVIDRGSYDHYCEALINRIGRTVFVTRAYQGNVPSIFKDAWEFGSVKMKVQSEMPEASENESWELVDGKTYNQDKFYKPVVSAKFFNKRVTFEVDRSITYIQIRESFNSAEQMNSFISMIFNEIEKSLTVKINSLAMRILNYATGYTMLADMTDGTFTGTTGVKAVNLLYKYNTDTGSTLTVNNCLTDIDFLAYAVKTINQYRNRLTQISTLFNVDGKQRFTPKDLQHLVVHADFDSSIIATLYRNSFHNEDLRLDNYETVPFWQGSGEDYDFADTSKIDVNLDDDTTVTASGIIATLFDDEACMVSNFERRVTTHDNKKAEFINYFYKQEAECLYDPAENYVVFYVA